MRLARRSGFGPHQLVVHRPLGVGQHHEPVVPLLHRIAQPGLPRLHDRRLSGRLGGRDQSHLAGLVVAAGDHDEAAGRRDAEVDEHALVRLLVDQHVGAGAAAHRAAEDLGRAAVLVAPDPEQVPRVGGEDEAAGGALDRVGQHRAGRKILQVDLVVLRSLIVGGVGEQGVVGTVLGRPNLEEGVALGQGVDVEQDLLGPVLPAGRAGVDRVLAAGLEPGVVGPGTVRIGDRGVVLLDPAAHLGQQRFLQRLGRGEQRLGVGVLRLQVPPDVGAQALGVPHHRLPVVVLHPGVVVDSDTSELLDAAGLAAGDGRRGAGVGHDRHLAIPARVRTQSAACVIFGRRPARLQTKDSDGDVTQGDSAAISARRIGCVSTSASWTRSRRGCGCRM